MSTIDTSSLSSGTGLDVTATVDQLMQTARAPERIWQSQQQTLSAQATALRNFNTKLDTLETRINDLKDVSGAFSQFSATSSNEAVFTATAQSGAVSGDHIIAVTQLATIASQYSDSLDGPDSSFSPGTLQFQIGGGDIQTVTFDASHSTLTTAVDTINGAKLGVTASLISDASGTRLVLVSNTSGSPGDLTIVSSPGGLALHTGTAGQNAKLTVDGVPIESATNDISGAVTSMTLHLNGDTTGLPVRLSINRDTDRVTSAINSFVSAYNDIVSSINSQFQYNETTKTSGVLAGDSTVRDLQARLLDFASFKSSSSGSIATLRSLGVEMQNDGTLQVNSSTLSMAVANSSSDVQAFFQGKNNDGFASTLSTQLAAATDPIDGPLLVDAKGKDDSVAALEDQIDNFEVQMSSKYQQLLDEYTRIDTLLRQMPLLENNIAAQLKSLSTSS
ncbi:MAG: flagellar filament capping protein FliD [Acidobacteriaceae bacterium]